MLPERKKKLIISIISIIVLIGLIFGISFLSSYIKEKNHVDERDNDNYPEKYKYIGIILDDEGVYRLFGLDENYVEISLNVHTFYKVQDLKFENNRIVLFSDAVNELRYEKEKQEFYFYDLNSYYNKRVEVKLAKDYLIFINEKTITYQDLVNNKNITNNITNASLGNVLVQDNYVYYVLDGGIYRYDLDKEEKILVVYPGLITGNLDILNLYDNYLIYSVNNDLRIYDIEKNTSINLSSKLHEINVDDFKFIDINNAYVIYMINDDEEYHLKEYSISQDKFLDYDYNLGNEYVLDSSMLDNNLFYMRLTDGDNIRFVLVDLASKKVISELENEYLYLIKVGV